MRKHEKVFTITVAIAYVLLLICSCTSSRGRITVGQSIVEYQQQIAALEAELTRRDTAIATAARDLEAITSRSSDMEGTIDELIELFNDYQQRVKQLLLDYRRLEQGSSREEQVSP